MPILNFSQTCENPTTQNCVVVHGGSSEFFMTTPANIDFEFDNFNKYARGITKHAATRLMLKIDELIEDQCKWALHVAINNDPHIADDEWWPIATYGPEGSEIGTIPNMDLLELRIYNTCGTQMEAAGSDFRNINIGGNTQNNDTLTIISPFADLSEDNSVCNNSPVNSPGSYLTNYNQYNFAVDYRINPGFNHRPGSYQVTLRFCLYEVNPED